MNKTAKNQEICSVCEAEPQDMLILSCRHNLCLDCATQVYKLNAKQNKIICEICLSQTGLDEDTVVCLRSLSAKNIKDNNFGNNGYEFNLNQNRQIFPPHPKNQTINYSKHVLPLINQQSDLPKCEKHNQILTYFCLDCNFYKICSECMLLQNHRFHKVITIKKATYQIKQNIQKVGRQKLKLKNLLQKDREHLSIRKDQSERQLQINLHELKSNFDEINKLILMKYEQLKTKMQEQAGRKLQIMQGAINQISQKIDLISQTVQFQQQLISSAVNGKQYNSVLQMFDYYESEMNQNKLNFEPSLPNFIAEVQEQVINQKQRIFQQFQNLLDQLTVSCEQLNGSCFDNNINHISQIQNSDKGDRQKKDYQVKNIYQQVQKGQNSQNKRRPISENINIIQISNKLKQQTNLNKKVQEKKTKSSIEAIKQKARQNFKDRELSSSRKTQLSRSLVNATQILNKIQQRTYKL